MKSEPVTYSNNGQFRFIECVVGTPRVGTNGNEKQRKAREGEQKEYEKKKNK